MNIISEYVPEVMPSASKDVTGNVTLIPHLILIHTDAHSHRLKLGKSFPTFLFRLIFTLMQEPL
jgi:hypothetical protein